MSVRVRVPAPHVLPVSCMGDVTYACTTKFNFLTILLRHRIRPPVAPAMHSAVFWLGFPALLLCNVFEGTRGSWLDGDFGVDRPGGDLPGMPVSLDPGQSATDCGSLCWSHSHCMAWSFSSAGCSGTDVSLCSLKARVTEQSYNPCTVR